MSRTGNGNGYGHGDRLHVTETPDVRHIGNPDVMHEESDVNVRGVGTFVAILTAAMIVVGALMVGMYNLFEWQAEREEAREHASPMARSDEERLPPAGVPRLQSAPGFGSLDDPKLSFELMHPQAEWEALRSKWEYELANPGPVDPNTGAGRIPIEEAKRQLLDRGLPARQPAAGAAETNGVDIPSLSSSGRQWEKRDR
jgi:hypothetical protein